VCLYRASFLLILQLAKASLFIDLCAALLLV
jgi:hypothetical protein